jgi:hypothetical protein
VSARISPSKVSQAGTSLVKPILALATIAVLGFTSVAVFPEPANASTACAGAVKPSGDGTSASPFLVASASELIWLSVEQDTAEQARTKHFLQAADIDLQGCLWSPVGTGIWDGDNGATGAFTTVVASPFRIFGSTFRPLIELGSLGSSGAIRLPVMEFCEISCW